MGWLDKLMFWRRGTSADDATTVADHAIEAVEGYTVDGCFTGPDGQLSPATTATQGPAEDLERAQHPDGAPPASG